ncbi:Fur family transcriptional regulator [Metalysinibacillus jejuensis]|uniref:Fur family transcriptional regulator n=1 Tax=Metalysinibacillus jejuensis TaxID=914327 RepID=UPI000D3C08D2|nr:Fur family transcriptional regulator [Metalysinibacillus jejuensis]
MNSVKAWEILKNNGYKRTNKRERLLQMFEANDKYVTARQLLDVLTVEYPGMSYDTIYRNLSTFVALGILDETELSGERHFRMQCDATEHHHHFICMDCGNVKALEICPMDMLGPNLQDYQVENHKFEIYGKCPQCH